MSEDNLPFTKNGNKLFSIYAKPNFPPLYRRKDGYSKLKRKIKRIRKLIE